MRAAGATQASAVPPAENSTFINKASPAVGGCRDALALRQRTRGLRVPGLRMCKARPGTSVCAFRPHLGLWAPTSAPEHPHLNLATWKVLAKCELSAEGWWEGAGLSRWEEHSLVLRLGFPFWLS